MSLPPPPPTWKNQRIRGARVAWAPENVLVFWNFFWLFFSFSTRDKSDNPSVSCCEASYSQSFYFQAELIFDVTCLFIILYSITSSIILNKYLHIQLMALNSMNTFLRTNY